MDHKMNLLIKYVYTAVITSVLLTYLLVPSISLGASLIVAVFVTLALYYLGDLYVLPRIGSLGAVFVEFIVAAVIFGLSNLFMTEIVTFSMAVVTAAIIAAAEWFFHRYLSMNIDAAVEDEGSLSLSVCKRCGDENCHDEKCRERDNHHE
ncbi:MAG: DUF2512 family protein [Dethiobacteria bacterium]